jgi:hypothetical protein
MKDLIKDTIGKIKKEHLLPEPKWRYLVRKYGIWALFGFVVIFAAAAFSAAYFLLSSLDWDLYSFMHQNMLSYSLSIFPYFWALVLGIFLLAAFFEIRRTETGYRFSWVKIILITIGSIVVLGAAMSFVGFGGRFNSMMANGVPFYGKHMMVTRESQWSNPAQGFLSGTIIKSSGSELEIVDLNAKNWNVLLSEKTLIRPRADVSVGQIIKIIGTQTNSNTFQALEIRPWMGQGMTGGVTGSGQSCGMMSGSCPMNRN